MTQLPALTIGLTRGVTVDAAGNATFMPVEHVAVQSFPATLQLKLFVHVRVAPDDFAPKVIHLDAEQGGTRGHVADVTFDIDQRIRNRRPVVGESESATVASEFAFEFQVFGAGPVTVIGEIDGGPSARATIEVSYRD